MTVGSPLKLILGFAIPMLMGYIFQNLYNLVDTAIIGRILGVNALAAVGTTGGIYFMVNGFTVGTTAGFAIPIAQRFGAGDESEMRKFVYNAAVLAGIFAVTVTVLICTFIRPILTLVRVPADIIQDSWTYIFIVFLGIPIAYLYNICAGIIRSLGDSKTPVYFLICSSLLNGALDVFTILVLGMGVEGPAIATVFSQLVAAILCLLYMRKNYPILRMKQEEKKVEKEKLKTLCLMGVPMGLQFSITAIGTTLNQAAVNALGAVAVAAFAAGSKVSIFLGSVYDALAGTMATYVGQNIGAGKPDRVYKGVLMANLIGIVYGFIVFGLMTVGGEFVATLFLGAGETEAIALTASMLRTYTIFYCILTLVNVVRASVQGMGFSSIAVFAGFFELFGRSVIALIFVPIFGFKAACFASPAAWVLADVFLVPLFFWGLKKRRAELAEKELITE